MQIPCGGWRRPHSYFLGDVPEIKNCFAYVKVSLLTLVQTFFWCEVRKSSIRRQQLLIHLHGNCTRLEVGTIA